jgi:hypothetical protein
MDLSAVKKKRSQIRYSQNSVLFGIVLGSYLCVLEIKRIFVKSG